MKRIITTIAAVTFLGAGLSACTDVEKAATLGAVAGAVGVAAVASTQRTRVCTDYYGRRYYC